MNGEEILITIISIYIAVMVIILLIPLIYYYISEPIKILKKAKGEKMRKKKNEELERQQQMIDELKDKIEYLELKENGAEITWGQYTLVRYVYDSEIKEISIGGDLQVYNKEEETDEYIILQSIGRIGNYDIEKWEQVTTFHIIDKSTGKMYDAQELNEELERYNEMQKMLNEIKEENKKEGE